MISEIAIEEMPDWLATAEPNLGELPLPELLTNSVYYPACGIDGRPVKHLGGNFHSFVYVDYGVKLDSAIKNINGFRGYHAIGYRVIDPPELPLQDFVRAPLPEIKTLFGWKPFALWTVYERDKSYGHDHGPKRFSLLYVGGEGVKTFEALYRANATSPAVIAIIQPGHGTCFEDPNSDLAHAVLKNPFGTPKYLLYGGTRERDVYDWACWDEYLNDRPLHFFGCRLQLWKRRD